MSNKYIAPLKGIDSFTCPHCGTLSSMTLSMHHFQEDAYVDNMTHAIAYHNELYIARCYSCGKKIIWIDGQYIYPNIIAE